MFAQVYYEEYIGYQCILRNKRKFPMDISFGVVFQIQSRFPIRSTITETMDFLAKSRFASLYELFANRIRIPSGYDGKKFAFAWWRLHKN